MPDRPRRHRRLRTAAGTLIGLVLATLGVAIAAGASLSGIRPALVETGDAPARSILSAADMRPGDVAKGEVTLVGAPASGAFTLAAGRVDQTPGPGGGLLGDRLDLLLEELPAAGQPSVVWSGRLTEMPVLSLPALAEGAERTYRFTATFVDGGRPVAQDNPLQGAAVDVRYDWTGAHLPEGDTAPSPDPTPTPTATPAPTRAPAPGRERSPEPVSPPAQRSAPVPAAASRQPAARRVPRFAIRVGGRPVQRSSRRVRLRASCNRPCRLLVRGSRQLAARRVQRGAPRPGRPVALSVRLSPAVRSRLRAGRAVRVRVSVYAIARDRAVSRVAKTIRLEPRSSNSHIRR